MRKNKRKPYALLMIVVGGYEIQRHAPVNFYKWKKNTQIHYLTKRWPGWYDCFDGVPWQLGGNSIHNN